jgi:phospholipid/cholesterol/gamma-HCH transport system permease protein
MSMFVSIGGGYLAGAITRLVSTSDYIYGIQYQFQGYDVFYALVKTVVFAFIITSISGYHGYKTQGGALEVGQASTTAVVHSSIFIILFNLILTQLLLA